VAQETLARVLLIWNIQCQDTYAPLCIRNRNTLPVNISFFISPAPVTSNKLVKSLEGTWAVVTLIRKRSVSSTRPSTVISSFCDLTSSTHTLSGRMHLNVFTWRDFTPSHYHVKQTEFLQRRGWGRGEGSGIDDREFNSSGTGLHGSRPGPRASARPDITENVQVRAWYRRFQWNIGHTRTVPCQHMNVTMLAASSWGSHGLSWHTQLWPFWCVLRIDRRVAVTLGGELRNSSGGWAGEIRCVRAPKRKASFGKKP